MRVGICRLIAVFTLCGALFAQFALAAEAKEIKIAFIGDSLTAGYGIDPAVAYPEIVGRILNTKGFRPTVINAGVSGATSASALSRAKWVGKRRPDWVVVALGANDGLRGLPVESMEENLDAAIVWIRRTGSKVLLVGMKAPPNMGEAYSKGFEAVFSRLAGKHGLPFVPFLLKNVAGRPQLNLADQIHPNEKGHQVMAQIVAEALLRSL